MNSKKEKKSQRNIDEEEGEDQKDDNSYSFYFVLKWVVGLLVVGLLVFLFVYFDLRGKFKAYFKTSIQPWIDRHPVTGPVTYVGIYILAVVAFLPGSALTIPGGMLFGPLLGTILVSLASTSGAALAFLVARYVGKSWVEEKAGDKVDKLQEGLKEHGWKFVAFTRLVPIFPFNLLNYMFGLTRISFWTYVGVSWVAMLPGTFAYVYSGYALKVATASGKGVKKTLIIISIAAGIMILVSLIPNLVKKTSAEDIAPEGVEED